MSVAGSVGSELSDSDYYGSEVSVQSTLADLLERFTVDFQPECALKLRTKAGPVVVGADYSQILGVKAGMGALVIKPSQPNNWWRRVKLDSSGTFTLRSRKLHWWLLTLDLTGHLNPLTRTFDFSYRLATKWDLTKGEYRNKRRFQLPMGDRAAQAEARLHWSISYSLPAIEGSMGTAEQSLPHEVHADVGYAHLSVPRLELVCWPRGRPDASSGSGGGSKKGSLAGDVASSAAATDGGEGVDAILAAEGVGAPDRLATGAAAAATAGPYPPAEGLAVQEGIGAYKSVGSGGKSSGNKVHRKCNLLQLSSHTASLSGRWWEAQSFSSWQ